MKLTKCSHGHFYDGDVYESCPHCMNGDKEENKTIPYYDEAYQTGGYDSMTVKKENVKGSGMDHGSLDDSKTISIYQCDKMETQEKSPVVGWLVCVEGKFYGQDFALRSGRNFIGRGADMEICLAGENTVSRVRHATITHEPRKNVFIAQPGESRELFYVNDNVVLSPTQLKKNDVIQVGNVRLMLIPCCDEVFDWSKGNEK